MTLDAEMDLIIAGYKANLQGIRHNSAIVDIYEGNLLDYVLDDLRSQLSESSFNTARHRVAPINLLQRIVGKTANIYSPEPARHVVGSSSDQAIFEWYREAIPLNEVMSQAAEMFAMCKGVLIQPYVDPRSRKPGLRVVQPDRYFVLSTDSIDDMQPTHVVTIDSKLKDNRPVAVFTVYTDDSILIFDEDREIDRAAMAAINNPNGENPVMAIPFIYATASKYRLMATPDSDLMRMTRLLPVLISDLNYAAMFQAFSVIYAINCDTAEFKLDPNVLWDIKSDPSREGAPSLGVIKPDVSYEGVMALIESQISIWLNSRGIRPGAVGSLSADRFGSGISKMIDEMDTYEARAALATRFKRLELDLWDLIINRMHPYWVRTGQLGMKEIFTREAKLDVVFASQQPMVRRGQQVADLAAELKEGFISKDRALRQLNPLMTDVEITTLQTEIEESTTVRGLALNGTQVDSMVQILERVAAGTLPKDSAKAVVRTAFSLSNEEIDAIVDPIIPASITLAQAGLGGSPGASPSPGGKGLVA